MGISKAKEDQDSRKTLYPSVKRKSRKKKCKQSRAENAAKKPRVQSIVAENVEIVQESPESIEIKTCSYNESLIDESNNDYVNDNDCGIEKDIVSKQRIDNVIDIVSTKHHDLSTTSTDFSVQYAITNDDVSAIDVKHVEKHSFDSNSLSDDSCSSIFSDSSVNSKMENLVETKIPKKSKRREHQSSSKTNVTKCTSHENVANVRPISNSDVNALQILSSVLTMIYALIVFIMCMVKTNCEKLKWSPSQNMKPAELKEYSRNLKRMIRIINRRCKNKVAKKRGSNRKPKRQSQPASNANIDKILLSLEEKCNGRRIVNVPHLWSELHSQLTDHVSKEGTCSAQNWRFHKESFCQGGALSVRFNFKCCVCRDERQIWSEPISEDILGITESAVLGTLCEGLGYSNVQGLFAVLGIGFPTDKTFKNELNGLFEKITGISRETMLEAGREEVALARKFGNVDEKGRPFITVIVDGAWTKRSYGKIYNALSGVAVIIGARTGKVLYVGVKNKYCTKCVRAENVFQKAQTHETCVRNFPLNRPSTQMESEALLDGFQESFKTHGIIYNCFVGDGDSSFHNAITKNNPYEELGHDAPQKIECTNHLLRNLQTKLGAVAKMTQKKGEKRDKGFVPTRKILGTSLLKIRRAIDAEIDREIAFKNKPWDQKVIDLRSRINNVPSHVFGEHAKCEELGLPCATDETLIDEVNHVPDLQKHGFYGKIEEHVKYLSNHSDSLLHKKTTNVVESFNAIICKLIGGKRINFALSNQYNIRVAIAVIHHNSYHRGTSAIFEGLKKAIPDTVTDLEDMRIAKNARNREDRANNGRKKLRSNGTAAEKFYGQNCEKPDCSQTIVDHLRQEHYDKLSGYQRDREHIERNTRKQPNCQLWKRVRKLLLTASNFGRVCTNKTHKSNLDLLISMLYPEEEHVTSAMAYGISAEEESLSELSKILKVPIVKNGIFIDPENPIFGATPDGLIGEDKIVEIKNPHSVIHLTPEEAMKQYPSYQFIDKRTKKMKESHLYHYQVQGQLHVTGRKSCYFAFRTPLGIVHTEVEKNDIFWAEKMEPKLISFYENYLLPEIIDSRYDRNMTIRNPKLGSSRSQPKIKASSTLQNNEENVISHVDEKMEIDDVGCKQDPGDIGNSDDDNINNEGSKNCDCNHETDNDEEFWNYDEINSDEDYDDNVDYDDSSCENDEMPRETVTDVGILPQAVINSDRRVQDIDDDCVIMHHEVYDQRLFTERDINSITTYIESRELSIEPGTRNRNLIADSEKQLNDEVIDLFIRIVNQHQQECEVHSVLYISYPSCVKPVSGNNGAAILGGCSTNHWRLAIYDGEKLFVYETMKSYSTRRAPPKLREKEMDYVRLRFPNISSDADVCFPRMRTYQPDSYSCGVYASSLLAYYILQGDPSGVKMCENPQTMRTHMLRILDTGELSLFPTA